MIDMNNADMLGEVIVSPEYPFPALPLQPDMILETVIITGSSSTSISITGTTDSGG